MTVELGKGGGSSRRFPKAVMRNREGGVGGDLHGTETGGGSGEWPEMEGAWQWSVKGKRLRFAGKGKNEGEGRGGEWEVSFGRKMTREGGGGGGGGVAVPRRRRRWRREDGGVALTVEKNRGRGKEWQRSSRRQRHGGVWRRQWKQRLDSFPGLP